MLLELFAGGSGGSVVAGVGRVRACLAASVLLLVTSPALGVDTLEPFGLGFSDAEMYVGLDQVGGSRRTTAAFFSGGVGAGLTERLSLFAGYGAEGNGYFSDAVKYVELSTYMNVGTWEHFAIDLGAAFVESDAVLESAPFYELNLDLEPEQALAGAYLRGGPHAAGTGSEVDWSWEQALGGYYRIVKDKQLLVEWNTSYDLGRKPVRAAWHRGSILAGFNWTVAPTLELITEVGASIPESDEPCRGLGSLGLLATF